MPVTLIEQKPNFVKKVREKRKLSISEMFTSTIQGEGVTTGTPSTFIRLQGCVLECKWCDTLDVWDKGNEYTFEEIFKIFEEHNLIERFREGEHLVLTGGSPLKQQKQLFEFLCEFLLTYKFLPFIELENECVLEPIIDIRYMISQYNNSPKLSNSGMKERVRYKPELIKKMSFLDNSWFKFVITSTYDWMEIERDFLPLIKRSQVILMPEGVTQKELNKNREWVADMAIKNGVRFSDRLHVTIFNKQTGV